MIKLLLLINVYFNFSMLFRLKNRCKDRYYSRNLQTFKHFFFIFVEIFAFLGTLTPILS